jgi:deltex-like protein
MKFISPIELYYKAKYEEFHKLSLDTDFCSICLCHFYDENLKTKSIEEIIKITNEVKADTIMLNNCSDHFFHLECIERLLGNSSSIKCPNCNKIYGILTGDQPNGSMIASVNKKMKCKGYENHYTIVIEYYFPDSKNYTGTTRVAYLPDNSDGREILGLLKVAFDRKLTFTVGTSVTTGISNTVVWNGIHHKTCLKGGSQYFGYPDATYFNRVKQELAAKGVTVESLGNKNLQLIIYEILCQELK